MSDEFPPCPDCESDWLVDGCHAAAEYICRDCGLRFDAPECIDLQHSERPQPRKPLRATALRAPRGDEE